MSFVIRLLRDSKGQTAVEYSLIAAGIGLALLVGLQGFSTQFNAMATVLIDALK